LAQDLRYHNKLYYAGEPAISDAETFWRTSAARS
jgi:hypothetical protein